jgi:hypothetical protein
VSVPEPYLPSLRGHHPHAGQRAGFRFDQGAVQQAQIVAVAFIAVDALVVVDEVAAAVQDELVAVPLHRAGGTRKKLLIQR